MRKILIFLIILGFLLSANYAYAGVSDLMPDSPFYFLKIWYEKLVLFFTFNAETKAEKYRLFAEKRALEAKQMVLKGKDSLVDGLKEKYTEYLNKAKDKLEAAIRKAVENKKEDIKKRLEQKVDEITNKLLESIL
ncbi:MAG: DUF5667 domain-containing protein [Patescibacteria group bacterium]